MSPSGNGSSRHGPESTIGQLEELIGQQHVASDYVRFRIELLKAQWIVRDALREKASSDGSGTQPGSPDHTRTPALRAEEIALDRDLLHSLFAATCAAVENSGGQSGDATRLANAAGDDPLLLEELVRVAALQPHADRLRTLSQQLDVQPDGLLFFGRMLAAPFVAEAARRVHLAEDVAVERRSAPGDCPVCGSPPGISELRRNDGIRVLHCSLCGSGWTFARVRCPHCRNDDNEKLAVLRLADDDPRWIETCEACKGYIKTVDARKLAGGDKVLPLVEEVATLHLDLLAEQEGYARSLPYAATT